MIEPYIPEAPVEPAFSYFFNFPFDPFQLEAMEQIRNNRSVMVAAPTSSGKTVVAEYALWQAVQNGTKAIYTTPIKALSNQKRRDLEDMFPGQVGLLTGDRSEHADAPIVVMTTEVLRNMLVEDSAAVASVSWVVFDEVHYLADPGRGTVWEEAIISCPSHIRLVCLSATIANAEEIAAWIGETQGDIALIRHDERPVPLEHRYYTQHRLHLVRDGAGHRRAMFPHEGKSAMPHPAEVVTALRDARLLPAIWFAFSRRAVEEAAQACAHAAQPLKRDRAQTIQAAIASTIAGIPEEDRSLPQLSLLVALLRRGIGFHHAGLLPPLKEMVERLFAEGLLDVVCATDTLAVGINMPARTVVISSLSRPFGGMLTPNDFSQLTGRAGRRGIDERGSVVMLPSPFHGFEDAYRAVSAPLQPIESTFRLRYSTLLSSMEGSDDRLQHLVRSSLRQYQMRAKIREIEEQRRAIDLESPEHLGQLEADVLDYLSLQSRLSHAEREQKRARSARSKGRGSAATRRRYDQAKEERERLLQVVRGHPQHGTVSEMERTDPDRVAQLRRIQTLDSTLRQVREECDQEASETADAVRAVLWELGYVREGGLTPKARGLREIVAASGIVLVELYERGVFNRLDAAEVAEVISWFACDADRRRQNRSWLPPALLRVRKRAATEYAHIAALERDEGIELAQGPSAWFHSVALAWCRGSSIADITQRVDLGEGDIVSLLNKTVDLLDQFASMLERRGDADLLRVTESSRSLLVRGLVALVRSGSQLTDVADQPASSVTIG